MKDRFQVTIGIQARSTSQRFPNKIMAELGGKTVLDWVLDACNRATAMVGRDQPLRRAGVVCNVAVCVPFGDPVIAKLPKYLRVVEGPEHDVLDRYQRMAVSTDSNAIVRVTSDCPFIPHFVIFKHIVFGALGSLDYLSNADEHCRTAPDGFDCEYISRQALELAHRSAVNSSDREHVTTYLRNNRSPALRYATMLHERLDPDDKCSIDTPADLEKLKKKLVRFDRSLNAAKDIYGEGNVFVL